jgi:tetratricopeptide (TPR) repeat protein
MKKTSILIFLSLVAAGCTSSATTPQQQTTTVSQTTNTNQTIQRSNDSTVISSHSTPKKNSEEGQTNSGGSSASSSGGSPMSKAIDVSEMTAGIEKADKEYKSKPNDAAAKDALAKAHFIRAFALTEAAQYRAALGDFRKGLKLNPNDKQAKDMHDRIISIFQSINREPPKEGEEPPPMPFTKS